MASQYHGFDNSYCADSVGRHPGRLVGIGLIDVEDPDVLELISYWTGERGLHGVRLHCGTRGGASWIDDAQYAPIWDQLAQSGVPVNAQTTFPGDLAATEKLLLKHPNLSLLICFLGHVSMADGPKTDAALQLFTLSRFTNVYTSLSAEMIAIALTEGSPEARFWAELLASYGACRILWSTYYPGSSDQPRDMRMLADTMRHATRTMTSQDRAALLGDRRKRSTRL